MNNGLCPECGCVMEQEDIAYTMDNDGDMDIVETRYECPCCQYWETVYDAE